MKQRWQPGLHLGKFYALQGFQVVLERQQVHVDVLCFHQSWKELKTVTTREVLPTWWTPSSQGEKDLRISDYKLILNQESSKQSRLPPETLLALLWMYGSPESPLP